MQLRVPLQPKRLKISLVIFCTCLVIVFVHLHRTNFWSIKKGNSHMKVTFQSDTVTYVYRWNNKKGHPFHPKISALSAVGFPFKNFVTITKSTLKDFVFVTAANWAYIKPALEGITIIQKLFPRKKIIFYDLGLDLSSLSQVCFR